MTRIYRYVRSDGERDVDLIDDQGAPSLLPGALRHDPYPQRVQISGNHGGGPARDPAASAMADQPR